MRYNTISLEKIYINNFTLVIYISSDIKKEERRGFARSTIPFRTRASEIWDLDDRGDPEILNARLDMPWQEVAFTCIQCKNNVSVSCFGT